VFQGKKTNSFRPCHEIAVPEENVAGDEPSAIVIEIWPGAVELVREPKA
jgi:hypothetical protein